MYGYEIYFPMVMRGIVHLAQKLLDIKDKRDNHGKQYEPRPT
jgi:hypothetical protein